MMSDEIKMKEMDKTIGKKNPYGVPEGYFSALEKRLGEIPAQSAGRSVPVRRKAVPYIAAAAALAAVITGGTAILGTMSEHSADGEISTLEMFRMSDLVPVTDPYLIYSSESEEEDDVTDEDIAEYLINSGTTLEYIAYYETGK